jgi:hypothetical protein
MARTGYCGKLDRPESRSSAILGPELTGPRELIVVRPLDGRSL